MIEEKKNAINSFYVAWMLWTAIGVIGTKSVEFALYSALAFINVLVWVNTVFYLIKSKKNPSGKNKFLLFFFGCLKFNMFLFLVFMGTRLENPIFSMSGLVMLPVVGGLYHAYKEKMCLKRKKMI